MIEQEQANFFALRRTNTTTGKIQWLVALIDNPSSGDRLIENEFYPKKESYEKVTWTDGDDPTWFKTLGDAKRRLNTRTIKLDKHEFNVRWDIVEVQLISRTKIAHTTAKDIITKMALITEGWHEAARI